MEQYDIPCSILSMDGDISELLDHEARISKVIFDVCLKIRQLLHRPIPVVHREGIRLPKIDVPMFYGDIMDWRRFWEQYEIPVHSRTNSLIQRSREASLSVAVAEGRLSPAHH